MHPVYAPIAAATHSRGMFVTGLELSWDPRASADTCHPVGLSYQVINFHGSPSGNQQPRRAYLSGRSQSGRMYSNSTDILVNRAPIVSLCTKDKST